MPAFSVSTPVPVISNCQRSCNAPDLPESYSSSPFNSSNFSFWGIKAVGQHSVLMGISVGNLIARWDDETFRVSFEKDVQMQEAMWERQHELATDKIYARFAKAIALPAAAMVN